MKTSTVDRHSFPSNSQLARAFAWLLWKRHCKEILIAVAALVIIRVGWIANNPWKFYSKVGAVLAVLGSLCFFICLIVLAGRLANAESRSSLASSSSSPSAYPPFMLTLPVSDRWMVLAPMVFGAICYLVLSALYLVLLGPTNSPTSSHSLADQVRGMAWPCLYVCSFTISLQALAWSRIERSALKMALALILLAGVFMLIIACWIWRFSLLIVPYVYGATAVLALLIGVPGFRRARHGPNLSPHRAADSVQDSEMQMAAETAKPPRSWTTWDRQGRVLPIAAACWCLLYLFALLGAHGVMQVRPNTDLPIDVDRLLHPIGLIVLILGTALFVGAFPRRTDILTSEGSVQQFVSTRPESGVQLIGKLFQTAAWGSLCAWAILVATLGLAASMRGFGGMGIGEFLGAKPLSWIPFGGLILTVLLYNYNTYLLAAEVSGRRWVSYVVVVALFVGLSLSWSADQSSSRWAAPVLFDLLWVAVIVKVLTATTAAGYLLGRKLISVKQLLLRYGCWLSVVAILIVCYRLIFTVDTYEYSSALVFDRLRHVGVGTQGDMLTLIALAVVITPFSRFFIAPLMYEWNRHR